MSDSFWRKVNIVVGLLAIGVLFGMLVMTSQVEIRDFDLWLHLGMGQFIVENGYVPEQDVLSCTIQGKPWNNHEWLFQVLAHKLFEGWGAQGLIYMQVGVVWLMILLLLFLGYHRDRQLLIIFSLLMVVLNYQARFTVRPEMFSLLCFTIYIYLLSIYIDRPWTVLALFIVQVFWSNLHGFFFFGPLFVMIAIFSEWAKRHVRLPYEWNTIGRLTNDEYSRLKKILIFVILACFINPQTIKGAIYPITVLLDINSGSKVFFQHIQELQKPIHWNTIFNIDKFIFYKLMILFSGYTFIFNRRKIDFSVLIFWVVFLLFSLVALRNIVFFAFAAYLVIITNSLSLKFNDIFPIRFTEQKYFHLTEIVLKIVLIIWMLDFGMGKSAGAYYDFDKFEYKSMTAGISHKQYPTKPVQFLKDNNIKGNMFNDFNSGAYLVGNVYPNLKVFIDGRTEVYGPEFFDLYMRIWRDGDMQLFEQMVKERNVTVALLNTSLDPAPKPLFQHLHNSQDWVAVFFDYDGAIYLRDVPEHKALIEKYGMDLSQWETEEMDLQRLGPQRVAPYRYINRGFSFQSIGLYRQAYTEAVQALKINPNYVGPYKILGKVHAKQGEYRKAFEYFRIAAQFEPGSRETKYNLAQTYYDLEDYEGAVRIYDNLIAMDVSQPKAHFLKARAQVKDGTYEDGQKTLQGALNISPKSVREVLDIGVMAADDGEWEAALGIYRLGLDRQDHQAEVHLKIGLAHQALGETQKALESLNQAHELDPENEEIIKGLKKAGGKISR